MSKVESQIEKLIAMKGELNRVIDEAVAALNEIEERSKSQEWLDYAEEYGFEEDELMNVAFDRLEVMKQHYNEAYELLYLDDIAYNSLDEIL